MARRNDKRERLVEAADTLFHRQGVSNTTLANIAALAEVPLGNVYYYFKSKDSITLAVLNRRKKYVQSLFADWNDKETVKARLAAFVEHAVTLAPESAEFGDALGCLCQELGKQGGAISETSATLMRDIIEWAENQFKALGKSSEEAAAFALNLVSSIQGISLLTLTFRDAEYVNRHSQYLNDWINTL